ncbi:MAG: hypothetical protein M1834_007934 [Cirrosporium novae-zelandiae]|nr:MAG: hypothetical protein M1834_007934 [Cirrosporium novae-zelandiae]
MTIFSFSVWVRGDPTSCPHTYRFQPKFTHGPTSTYFSTTATVTVSVECGDCDKLVVKKLGGLGPMVHYTTTVTTDTATTVSQYVCAKTGQASVENKERIVKNSDWMTGEVKAMGNAGVYVS